ncbi:MAG: hypothetical protein K6F77_01080 [Lachnospiraceae bacterium]|nr:hypothetical protein [Lachnospiraceae bacterium]
MNMIINASDIDFESLRDDLMDHYGTAMGDFPMAVMDVVDVETASQSELVELADEAGIDIRRYIN